MNRQLFGISDIRGLTREEIARAAEQIAPCHHELLQELWNSPHKDALAATAKKMGITKERLRQLTERLCKAVQKAVGEEGQYLCNKRVKVIASAIFHWKNPIGSFFGLDPEIQYLEFVKKIDLPFMPSVGMSLYFSRPASDYYEYEFTVKELHWLYDRPNELSVIDRCDCDHFNPPESFLLVSDLHEYGFISTDKNFTLPLPQSEPPA